MHGEGLEAARPPLLAVVCRVLAVRRLVVSIDQASPTVMRSPSTLTCRTRPSCETSSQPPAVCTTRSKTGSFSTTKNGLLRTRAASAPLSSSRDQLQRAVAAEDEETALTGRHDDRAARDGDLAHEPALHDVHDAHGLRGRHVEHHDVALVVEQPNVVAEGERRGLGRNLDLGLGREVARSTTVSTSVRVPVTPRE